MAWHSQPGFSAKYQRDSRMGIDGESLKNCSICGQKAVTMCDGCLRPLCKKCRGIEIWRTMKEEVIIKSFCPQCRATLKADGEDGRGSVFGLGQVTSMVNREQHKLSRFKIKLRMK